MFHRYTSAKSFKSYSAFILVMPLLNPSRQGLVKVLTSNGVLEKPWLFVILMLLTASCVFLSQYSLQRVCVLVFYISSEIARLFLLNMNMKIGNFEFTRWYFNDETMILIILHVSMGTRIRCWDWLKVPVDWRYHYVTLGNGYSLVVIYYQPYWMSHRLLVRSGTLSCWVWFFWAKSCPFWNHLRYMGWPFACWYACRYESLP